MENNKNKVAIVTGAAKNIGRATCIELAKLNFNILIHANTDVEGAKKHFPKVEELGAEADVIIGDLTDKTF